jgi:hypothetical protein
MGFRLVFARQAVRSWPYGIQRADYLIDRLVSKNAPPAKNNIGSYEELQYLFKTAVKFDNFTSWYAALQ